MGVDDLTLLLTLALFRIFGCHIISLAFAISYAWDFALTNVLFLGLYLLIFNLKFMLGIYKNIYLITNERPLHTIRNCNTLATREHHP